LSKRALPESSHTLTQAMWSLRIRAAAADLVAYLEAAILNAHGFPVTVLIRRLADFEVLVRALPESWRNDDRQKCDVLFLNDAIDSPGLVEKTGS
jgi:uncharacterized protein (DUF1697 family)